MKGKSYTDEEYKTMIRMYYDGYTADEIAGVIGRTRRSVHQMVYKYRKAHPEKGMAKKKQIVYGSEETAETMIKKLYDWGYRIENNTLVRYTKEVVRIQDIINVIHED